MINLKRLESFLEISSEFPLSSNPFQTQWYLDTYTKHFCKKEDVFLFAFYNDGKSIGYGAFEKIENKMFLLGMKSVINGQEITDYGDIVIDSAYNNYFQEVSDKLQEWFLQNGVQFLQLDYVREGSMTVNLFKDNSKEQIAAPYITLPKTWDEYLLLLDRVDRKELKRKMRRLNTVTHDYICVEKPTENDFEEFIRLHRLSSGEKDEFMSDAMKAFFWDLVNVEKKDWKTTLCFLQIEGKNVAAIISFENESGVFGYNSGYDPSFNYYSVGLLLHAYKIKDAIEKRKKTYDFMRGTERYKYDLGGKDMKLYKIELMSEK